MRAPLVDLVLEVYIIIHAKLGILLDSKAFINIVYKHRITVKIEQVSVQHISSGYLGSSAWSQVISQQNHLRKALKVSDILFLVASRVAINKRHRPTFSLLEYTLYAKWNLWLFLTVSLHSRTTEPSPTAWPLSFTWL